MAKALAQIYDIYSFGVPGVFNIAVRVALDDSQLFGFGTETVFGRSAVQFNQAIKDAVIAACQNPALASPTVVLTAGDILVIGGGV